MDKIVRMNENSGMRAGINGHMAGPRSRDSTMRRVASVLATICSKGIGAAVPEMIASGKCLPLSTVAFVLPKT